MRGTLEKNDKNKSDMNFFVFVQFFAINIFKNGICFIAKYHTWCRVYCINMRLEAVQLEQLVRWLNEGLTQAEVANRLNVSQSVISRAWNRHRTLGNAAYTHGGGRERATTAAEDRLMLLTARRNPTFTASRINSLFRQATGRVICGQTVRNRLHARNLRARRRVTHPRLSRQQRGERNRWAIEHRNWNLQRWGSCMFTDESRFRLYHSDGRVLVWREQGMRYNERFMSPTTLFGGGSVCVWGGICFNGRTELVVLINATMTAARYRDMVIEPIIVPFAAAIGDNFILIDDNARPHRARIVNDRIEHHGIERMDWPACSPDMNCIEHVWSEMSRRFNQLQQPPQTLQQLAIVLEDIWQNIPQQFINNLIVTMPNRVRALRRARGGPTRY